MNAGRQVERALGSRMAQADFGFLRDEGHLEYVHGGWPTAVDEAAEAIRVRRAERVVSDPGERLSRFASLDLFEQALSAARWDFANNSAEVLKFRFDHVESPMDDDEIPAWRRDHRIEALLGDELGAELEDLHFWEAGDGLRFLLTGFIPPVSAIVIDADFLGDPDPRRRPRFTISVDADVRPGDLADLYARHRGQARVDFGIGRFGATSESSLRAAAFALPLPTDLSWRERFRRFRREHPKDAERFGDSRSFSRAVGRVQQRFGQKLTAAAIDGVRSQVQGADPEAGIDDTSADTSLGDRRLRDDDVSG